MGRLAISPLSDRRSSILGQSGRQIMGRESDLWADFKESVAGRGYFERIENGVGSGNPDVDYTFRCPIRKEQRTGKIELKVIEFLPGFRNEKDCLFVSHFRKAQRVWHTRYAMYGGTAFVLLYIRRTKQYWLFTGKEACKWMGRSLQATDIGKMKLELNLSGKFPTEQLLRIL